MYSIGCEPLTPSELDSRHIEINGTCSYEYNSTCQFLCKQGYFSNQQMSGRCSMSGSLSPPAPTCHAQFCPKLSKGVYSTGWTCGGEQPVYQTSCSSMCLEGYAPRQGTSTNIVCSLNTNGEGGVDWSGNPLACDPVLCGSLPSITDGHYDHLSCTNSSLSRKYGDLCLPRCQPGYRLEPPITYECQQDGQWSNQGINPICRDVTPPTITSYPVDVTLNNDEGKSYATHSVQYPTASDNSGEDVLVEVQLKYRDGGWEDYTANQDFRIGKTLVRFNVSDRAGNHRTASCTVEVKDVEKPRVVQCAGPAVNENGFIFSQERNALVDWVTPTFEDNSQLSITSTGSPGFYQTGRSWTITYTAIDEYDNTAVCTFTFKVSGVPCPQIDSPQNGAMTCDTLAFGIYCMPSCQRGYRPLLPDDIPFGRMPYDYFCAPNGNWRPHDIVPSCAVRSEGNLDDGFEFISRFDGDCNDEQTRKQIILQTIGALTSGNGVSGLGSGFNATFGSDGFDIDHFHVRCGTKNESIVVVDGN